MLLMMKVEWMLDRYKNNDADKEDWQTKQQYEIKQVLGMSLILNISIFPCDAIKLHTFQLKVVALKDTSQYQDVFCVSEF